MHISELWCYPIKSCAGIQLAETVISTRGIIHDREYMVVDAVSGMFVAQRSGRGLGVATKTMCQIETSLANDQLFVTAPAMPKMGVRSDIPEPKKQAKKKVRKGDYRLVRFANQITRQAPTGDSELAFADAFPFLIISQASLDDLNRRIVTETLPMNRFRPNIAIEGCAAYAEDRMNRIRIRHQEKSVDFEGQKLCVRCAITTTNQRTAERGKEPLQTLARYRRSPYGSGVVFGRNFNHRGTGEAEVGDEIEVLEWAAGVPGGGSWTGVSA